MSQTSAVEEKAPRKPQYYASDQEVRWCPGCGDYSILQQVKKTLGAVDVDTHNVAFISGIGCSSRFPYYMNTYGIHGIHGRALAIATGLKLARQDIDVWVVTGDGDGLSIGGNHLIHALRRNVNLKIILFNNRVYGLTKGQASPTSVEGQLTPSTPFGFVGQSFNPISMAIGCEATFVARSIDRNPKHLEYVLKRAAEHKGSAFVEVYQNCNIFNDGAFSALTDKQTRDESMLFLEDKKPMTFGKNNEYGIQLSRCFQPSRVKIGEDGVKEEDLLTHQENWEDLSYPFLLSRFKYPALPEPMGVFRAVDRPTLNDLLIKQIDKVKEKRGEPDLTQLLKGPDPWEV